MKFGKFYLWQGKNIVPTLLNQDAEIKTFVKPIYLFSDFPVQQEVCVLFKIFCMALK